VASGNNNYISLIGLYLSWLLTWWTWLIRTSSWLAANNWAGMNFDWLDTIDLGLSRVRGLWVLGVIKNQTKIRSCKYCNQDKRLEIQNHRSEQRW
jgi:hypothetical protein